MTLRPARFQQACRAREQYAASKGYDGWTQHPAKIAAEMLEEAVDIPIWSKGITSRPTSWRQRVLIWTIRQVAMVAWYVTDRLRRSLM